jgi:hypothetical protein
MLHNPKKEIKKTHAIHVAPGLGLHPELIYRGRAMSFKGSGATAIGQLDSTKSKKSPLLPNSLTRAQSGCMMAQQVSASPGLHVLAYVLEDSPARLGSVCEPPLS